MSKSYEELKVMERELMIWDHVLIAVVGYLGFYGVVALVIFGCLNGL